MGHETNMGDPLSPLSSDPAEERQFLRTRGLANPTDYQIGFHTKSRQIMASSEAATI